MKTVRRWSGAGKAQPQSILLRGDALQPEAVPTMRCAKRVVLALGKATQGRALTPDSVLCAMTLAAERIHQTSLGVVIE